jgi:hypothetical protein
MLEPSARRSLLERRLWNEAGPYPIMPTSLVAVKGAGLALGSSLAYVPAVFVRRNKSWPCSEHGGHSGVPPESWWKKFYSENRTRSTSLAEGSAPSMSSRCHASASVPRSASSLFEGVSPSSGVRVGSSWRWSMPR